MSGLVSVVSVSGGAAGWEAAAGAAVAARLAAWGSPRVVVVGGPRSWVSRAELVAVLSRLPAGVVVASGGARGADSVAAAVASELGFRVLVLPAPWSVLGPRVAGVVRSRVLLSAPGVWGLLACVPAAGLSVGTGHTVALARAAGLPVWAVRPSSPVPPSALGDAVRGGSSDNSSHPTSKPHQLGSGSVRRQPSVAPLRTSDPVQRQPIELDEEYAALELGEYVVGDWVDDGWHEDLSVCTFSDQLYEEVEIAEADYSVKQQNWMRLPEWELQVEKRWEDTQLLDAPHTGYASAQHGRDLGEKPAVSADTAWEIAVDTELQRDARLEALAIRQLAFSLAKAFETPTRPTEPRGELPQIRGHVRVGPPIAA